MVKNRAGLFKRSSRKNLTGWIGLASSPEPFPTKNLALIATDEQSGGGSSNQDEPLKNLLGPFHFIRSGSLKKLI